MPNRALLLVVLTLASACHKSDPQAPLAPGQPGQQPGQPSQPKPAVLAAPVAVAELEPNDFQRAQLIPARAIVSGTIAPPRPRSSDEDWYRVAPEPGTTLALEVSLKGAPALELEVLDRDRNRLIKVHAPEGEGAFVPAVACSEACFVLVSGAVAGPYTLTVLGAPPAAGRELEPNGRAVDANELAAGTPMQATFTSGDDEDWYRLIIAAPQPGQFLRVEVSAVSGVRPELEVRALADGALLATLRSTGPGEALFVRDLALGLGDEKPAAASAALGAGSAVDAGSAAAASGSAAAAETADAGASAAAQPEDGGAAMRAAIAPPAPSAGPAANPGAPAANSNAAAANPNSTAMNPSAPAANANAPAANPNGPSADPSAPAAPAPPPSPSAPLAAAPVPAASPLAAPPIAAPPIAAPPIAAPPIAAPPIAAPPIAAASTGYYLVLKSGWLVAAPKAKPTRGASQRVPYTLLVTVESGPPDLEREPNDDPAHASPLSAQGTATGYLAPAGDADWYRLHADAPMVLRVELTGLDRADLELSVWGPPQKSAEPALRSADQGAGKPVLLARANEGGVKEGEVLPAVGIPAGDSFIKVESALRQLEGRWVRDGEDRANVYKLTAALTPDDGASEREPNNDPDTAQPLTLPIDVKGFIWPHKDLDVFRFHVGPDHAPISVHLSAVRGVDLSLRLFELKPGKTKAGANAVNAEVIGSADAAHGEGEEQLLEVPMREGDYAVEVSSPHGKDASPTKPYQLTIR